MPLKFLALALCGLLGLAAHAEHASPPDECRATSADFSPAAALQDHLRREPACSRDAAFLYRLGKLLNLARRYPEAADRLEASLLRNPDDQSTLVEYAIALAGSGDPTGARHLLDQARQHPDSDPEIRRQAELLLFRPTWLPNANQGTLTLSVGHDDNLLGSTGRGTIDLTLPDGILSVELAGDHQPRAGGFVRLDLRFDGLWQPAEALPMRYGVFGSVRQTPGNPADRIHWGWVLEKSNTLLFEGYAQLAFQELVFQSNAVFRQAHLGLGLSGAVSPGEMACRQRLGTELQRRDYPMIGRLDGDYAGLHLQASCRQPNLQASLRLGKDRARDPARPGGHQHLASLRIAGQADLSGGNLLAEAEWSWQRDTTGYSPLLDYNRRRELHRSIYRLEYRWGSAGWQPHVGIEWLRQRANLPLFALGNRVFTLGISTSW